MYNIACTYTDDLSKDKVATQSTNPYYPYDTTRFAAGNAVDRNITTCMRTEPIGSNNPDKSMWWRVDLGDVYNIYSVNLLFKKYEGYGILLNF